MDNLPLRGKRCQCPSCKRFFNSIAAFDKHRVGKYEKGRICAEPKSLGMAKNAAGYWVTQLRGDFDG